MSYIDTSRIPDDTKVEVQNMTSGTLSYRLPSGPYRLFSNNMRMTVTAGELRELATTQGGRVLLQSHLSVHNPELAREFGVDEDTVEYTWTEEDIRRVLTEGDMDELLDALDFAPEGIVEELARKAVEWKIPDNNKIKAISEATNLDIASQIRNQEQIEQKDAEFGTNRGRAEQRRVRNNGNASGSKRRRKA